MQLLSTLLIGVPVKEVIGSVHIPIVELCFNSQKATPHACFVAMVGTQVDGHHYIAEAITLGSKAVVCERLVAPIQQDITYVVVDTTTQALGIMAANFYDHPSKKLQLIAVTGTNGKTTVVHLLYAMSMKMGYKAGMFSTVHNKIVDKTYPSSHTTPDAWQIQSLLYRMVKAGCTYCFMEASSHAIVQDRLAGLHFIGAIFTNITHEHLDYHVDFLSYIKAKKKLFDALPKTAFALVNKQDKNASVMLQNCKAKKFTFSLDGSAYFNAKIVTSTLYGLELAMGNQQQVWFRLIGPFNASNLLVAYSTAKLLGWEEQTSLMALSVVPPIVGRMDQVNHKRTGPQVFIDFAHTPDALEKVMKLLRNMLPPHGRLLTVMGCGGDRDRQKRAMIGKILADYSDIAIFTSDNPRSEDPLAIINHMQQGLSTATSVLVMVDRAAAIKQACLLATVIDVVLVAGKGHQCYEEIQGVKYDFQERKMIQATLNGDLCAGV